MQIELINLQLSSRIDTNLVSFKKDFLSRIMRLGKIGLYFLLFQYDYEIRTESVKRISRVFSIRWLKFF